MSVGWLKCPNWECIECLESRGRATENVFWARSRTLEAASSVDWAVYDLPAKGFLCLGISVFDILCMIFALPGRARGCRRVSASFTFDGLQRVTESNF